MLITVQREAPTAAQRPYKPYGVALDLLYSHAPEVVLSGPAGTGKSRSCLEKLYLCATKYPGMRGLVARKTRRSLTQTAMVTFERQVLPEGSPVAFHGQDQEYRFPNGSTIVVGGLDKPSKIMSAEYDLAYVQEATELTETDWESITTRLRNGVIPYQQLIADCNPEAPRHWLKKRADRGALAMLESRHEDNPTLWDHGAGRWTPRGEAYISKLDALTGVRYLRLRLGKWAAAEGMVYEMWDPQAHLVDQFEIPADWTRYRVIDFGYQNPFVCQWWAEDGDGRLFRYRELYGTQRLVEDWARQIVALSEGESILLTISDHDAEDRATLERYGIWTVPAKKEISPGVQAVQARLRKAGDGRPRLFLMRDALVERDGRLDEAKLPACTEEEFDGYIWAQTPEGKSLKEQPVKKNDHGLDATRYIVQHLDARPKAQEYTESIY